MVVGGWLLVAGRWFVGCWWMSLVDGRWWMVIGRWSSVVGCWSVGRWSLVVGRWSLVAGCWLLVDGHGHGQKYLESLSVYSLCQNSKVAVTESVSE